MFVQRLKIADSRRIYRVRKKIANVVYSRLCAHTTKSHRSIYPYIRVIYTLDMFVLFKRAVQTFIEKRRCNSILIGFFVLFVSNLNTILLLNIYVYARVRLNNVLHVRTNEE